MYTIYFTKKMKKDLNLLKKRGKDISMLTDVLDILSCGQKLAERYRDHQLSGDKADFRESQIEPDWLTLQKPVLKLIYSECSYLKRSDSSSLDRGSKPLYFLS